MPHSLSMLRPHPNRPRDRRAAKQAEDVPASHGAALSSDECSRYVRVRWRSRSSAGADRHTFSDAPAGPRGPSEPRAPQRLLSSASSRSRLSTYRAVPLVSGTPRAGVGVGCSNVATPRRYASSAALSYTAIARAANKTAMLSASATTKALLQSAARPPFGFRWEALNEFAPSSYTLRCGLRRLFPLCVPIYQC
jgi:hypothetical protein